MSEAFNNLIALDFDLTCTARLEIYDTEREMRQLEAMSLGTLTNALGGNPQVETKVEKFKEGAF